jgi:hypothetical protein
MPILNEVYIMFVCKTYVISILNVWWNLKTIYYLVSKFYFEYIVKQGNFILYTYDKMRFTKP